MAELEANKCHRSNSSRIISIDVQRPCILTACSPFQRTTRIINFKCRKIELHRENCIEVTRNIQMDSTKLKHDPFCWKCCKENANQQCCECERSFHVNCIGMGHESIDKDADWICPVCVTIKSAKIADKQKGFEMLSIIMDRIYNDPMYVDYRSMSKQMKGRADDVIIVKPMNLNILKEKMATYQNYEQFLADVKWMVHNCVILCSESHEKSLMAKILLDYFIDEIESVKKCAECYANATKHSDTWFTLACNEPHLLIWAKQKGFNYWPAKLMSIDGVLINVRFFGDHTHADIPATSCLLYSKTNPARMKQTSNIFSSALKEADKYIANIREKFGTFNLVEDRVVIDPAKYETYMAEAFPDLAQYRQAQFDGAASAGTGEPIDKRARLMEMDDGDTTERSNQLVREGNGTSLFKSARQRNFNDCLNELVAMNEQHTHALINLKAEYNAKLEQMQRDYDRRVVEVKEKCFNEAGF